jgi:hypothetical protein
VGPWLIAFTGAALLLLLALKLRGPRNRTDLRRPPKRKRRRITADEAWRVRKLVARGDEGGALRLIREAGYDEGRARKLVALVARLETLVGPTDPSPDPGWTEAVRHEDGLTYGRAFDYNETLRAQDARGRRGELDSKE